MRRPDDRWPVDRASPVPRDVRSVQGRPAGLVTRLAAAVMDAVVVCLVLLAAYVTVTGLVYLLDPRGFTFPDASLLASLAAALAVLVVYLTLAWWSVGRSYGCHVMGLRVVGPDGDALRLVPAFVRAVLCALVPIGLFWVVVSSRNRSLQDVLLHSRVVYDWQPRAARRRRS